MPIDLRENYEIGLGQVCLNCAKEASEIKCDNDIVNWLINISKMPKDK